MASTAALYAKLAWWEFRGNPRSLLLPLLTLAAGIACMMTASSISGRLAARGAAGAHQWIAADLLVLRYDSEALDRIRAHGLKATRVCEWNTRAEDLTGAQSRLAAVKSVDPNEYPYHGSLPLEDGADGRAALKQGSILISRQFAEAFRLKPGQQIRLGSRPFRIGGILRQEPDRWAGPNVAGLRAMIPQSSDDEQSSALLERILVQRPPTMTVSELRQTLEQLNPEALITDALGSTARMNETLEWVAVCLEILRWLGMGFTILAMIAVAQMQLLEHRATLRILRCLGARPATIERAFLVSMAMIATPGILIGLALAPSLTHLLLAWIEGFIGPLPAGPTLPWPMALFAWGLVMASAWLAVRQPRTRPPQRVWGPKFLADTRLRFTLSAALACGVALISIAYFVDDSLALQLVRNSPFGDPNLLLLKATTNDRPGLEKLLADPSYGVKRWRIIPFVRLASRNGKPGLWLVTCATGLGNQVRVDRRLLRQMQLKPGDTLRLGLGNGELAGPIQEETQLSPLSRFWEGVVVDCSRFPYADAFWNGGAWIDPARIPALEAQLAPGVIPVRMNEVEEIVAESGRNAVVLLDVSAMGSLLITFLLTSLLVKMAADRRQREIAVLRALGATSATIIRRLAKEFARDALLAAMAGVALGTLVTYCVMRYLTGDWPAPPSLAACLAITVGAAALSTGLAVLSCRPYWRCRPMDILRRVTGADLC